MQVPATQDQHINEFARRAFRDVADMDYVAARLSLRNHLIPQFLWSSLQAFEKYFKYILLVNRVPNKQATHDIQSVLETIRKNLPFVADMHPDDHDVFTQVSNYGADRYLINSWSVDGLLLPQLDQAIWDVRRYCQPSLYCPNPTPEQIQKNDQLLKAIADSRSKPQAFKIKDGLLENFLSDKHHPSNGALRWQNAFFGARSRRSVKAQFYLSGSNAPLLLYPAMIDDLDQLIHIPKKLASEYRALRDVKLKSAAPAVP